MHTCMAMLAVSVFLLLNQVEDTPSGHNNTRRESWTMVQSTFLWFAFGLLSFIIMHTCMAMLAVSVFLALHLS